MIAVVVLVFIAVGLPLLAWWVGGRPFWGRLRPGTGSDPWGDAMRRHGLTPQEAAQVEGAVMWGRQVEGDRLRRATVAWAQELIEQRRAHSRTRTPRARLALAGGFALLVVAAVAYFGLVVREVPWGLIVIWTLLIPFNVRLARAPERAIRLNSAPQFGERST